ncbi:DUF434 domain-containing protein [Prosthecobacter vanneervenii]|uniref:DUF434 domain-containing protein n=1 Tax=Prosthecobacter vanneervenii TaxID=48466 RepID=UPI001C840F1A|nr:DUF434 domain-containing protein [Prosthecobacter vanneervenii]
MSGVERHRGRHPADEELFAAEAAPVLRVAVEELSWLMSRGYARNSAVKLVGDRHELRERQRLAAGRAACADAAREGRAQRQLLAEALRGRGVMVDGFNLLVSLEAALSGGVLLRCRDGCVRDMSSVHGSYHAVAETDAAVVLAGSRLAELGAASVHWLLDKPVSNSGRLAARLRELAEQHGWPWTVDTVFNPDAELIAARDVVVVSSDAVVIDGAPCWYNLAADLILGGRCGQPWVVDLGEVH